VPAWLGFWQGPGGAAHCVPTAPGHGRGRQIAGRRSDGQPHVSSPLPESKCAGWLGAGHGVEAPEAAGISSSGWREVWEPRKHAAEGAGLQASRPGFEVPPRARLRYNHTHPTARSPLAAPSAPWCSVACGSWCHSSPRPHCTQAPAPLCCASLTITEDLCQLLEEPRAPRAVREWVSTFANRVSVRDRCSPRAQ
jgi:hypothetical protein